MLRTEFRQLQPAAIQNELIVTLTRSQQGLCADCVWARLVRTRRGSTFLRCAKAGEDPRFPKYPPLPVRRCSGYVRSDSAARAERDL